jgi:hypothetical protein
MIWFALFLCVSSAYALVEDVQQCGKPYTPPISRLRGTNNTAQTFIENEIVHSARRVMHSVQQFLVLPLRVFVDANQIILYALLYPATFVVDSVELRGFLCIVERIVDDLNVD